MIPDPFIGRLFAGYRIESLLGVGGMSRVYRAEQIALERKVAMKVLPPHFALDSDYRTRFLRECRIAASIEHPNILPIYDAGEIDGYLFIAMRLVAGTDLKSALQRQGPFTTGQTLGVIRQTAAALDAAHAAGLIHRDVKPANILLDREHVYLTDFGVAKMGEGPSQFTRIGLFVGTIDYASPEQIQNEAIDGRTDIYSLGCVFYECLIGRTPFERPTEHGVMQAQLTDEPPTVRSVRPELSPAVDAVIATAMAKNRDMRYRTASLFAEAARLALEGATGSVRPTVIVPTSYGATAATGPFPAWTDQAATAAHIQPRSSPTRSRAVGLGMVAMLALAGVAYALNAGSLLSRTPGPTTSASANGSSSTASQGASPSPATPPPTIERPPFVGRPVALKASQLIMPPGEFPFRGYIIGVDSGFEFITSSYWTREFNSNNADYFYIQITVTVYSPATSGAAQLAKATCDITFKDPPFPTVSEVTSEVIADGAKACQYHFEGNISDWVQYQTATRNVVISVAGEPRPRSISNVTSMSQMVAIARQQIAIIDRVAPR